MKFIKKINEFGRSMIEIIGVLVIIGLLSSAGVIGYKSAHDTYRATGIMDAVMKSKLAVEADYKVAGETTLLRALENGPIANPSDNVSFHNEVDCYHGRKCKEFIINATESAGVCEKIVLRQSLYNSSDDEDAKTGISITPDNVEACGEEGDVLMTFSIKVPIREKKDGTNVYTPLDPKLDVPTCSAVNHTLINGECVCNPKCDRGNDICICCNDGEHTVWSDELGICICPDGTHDDGTNCITCTEPKTQWDDILKECICPDGTHDDGTNCITCTEPKTQWDDTLKECICPSETPYFDGTNCITCDEKSSDTPYWNGTECTPCPTTAPYWDSTEEVCKCPDTSTWDEDWNACTFKIKLASFSACNNDCGASSVAEKFSVSNLEASYEAYYTGYADDWYWVCESTLSGLTASECRLKKASINLVAGGTKTNMYVGVAYAGSGTTKGYWQSYQGLMAISGTMTFVYNPNIKDMNYCPIDFYCPDGLVAQCTGQSTPDEIEQSVCHTCKERFWRSSDGSCFYCENTSNQTKIEQSECNRCENRFWKSNNYCYHCSVSDQSGIAKAECERCENRYWLETNEKCSVCPSGMLRDETTGVCQCDEGYFLNLSNKKCVSCTGTTGGISSTELATEQSCPQTRYYANNGSSYLCSATGNYPATTQENCMFCGNKDIRFWKSKNSYCYSCAYTSAVADTTQEECNVCSERFWKSNGNCYHCSAATQSDITKEECIKCSNRYWTVTDEVNGLGKCTKCASGTTQNADGTACE